MKFKIGDHIEPIELNKGFSNAVVTGIYTAKKGKFKNREMYFLNIPCGTATIPVEAERFYKVCNPKRNKL